MHARTEALLMAADRAQHVAEVIEPTLAAGRHVITDRFLASSVAYQGAARGLPPDEIRRLSVWATNGRLPDLTVFLRVSLSVVLARLASTGEPDRLESEGSAFLAKVVESYDVQAAAEPDRWVVVDGDASIDEVESRVAAAVLPWLSDAAS